MKATALAFLAPTPFRQTLQRFGRSPQKLQLQTADTTVNLLNSIKVMSPIQSNEEDGEGEGEGEGEDEEDDEDEEGNGSVQEVPIVSSTSNAGVELVKGVFFPSALNGSDVRVGIIMTRWNPEIIQGLFKGVNESLTACGVRPEHVFATYVPGAFELPITAKLLAMSKRFDVILCLGCLIKGETMHFEYIAQATSSGIMQVGLDSLVPTVFGVLTVLTKEQAVKRSQGETNEGLSWGKTAVEMGLARMSALGMDKSKKQKSQQTSQFVTFKGMPSAPSSSSTDEGEQTSQKSPQRNIGF